MCSLVLGIFALCLFFVPLLPPLLGTFTVLCSIGPFRKKRRRSFASIGIACAVLGNMLYLWIWTYGHLP